MTIEQYRVEKLKQLDDARALLNDIETAFRGSFEFRDAVVDLLDGTPFAAPQGDDYEGLYGRLRNALQAGISKAKP